ncbi:MAG: PilZ domain-containing protein [Gammaproteobacteria bacterium]|nr:PilZ domain-containing protein [Gammaproteobacteria bacterium]
MFWKKKKNIDLDIDSRFNDGRGAYRIAPDKSRPILLTISGISYQVLNVSGTGVCFRSNDLQVGTHCAAMVRLPSEDAVFQVKLEVLANQNGLCRCSFVNIHEAAENLLHSYILNLQKEKIRQNLSH